MARLGERLGRIEQRFDRGQLGFERVASRRRSSESGARYRPLTVIDTGQDRLQSVVIFLRDRIELMVVTPRALEREAEKRRPGRGDHIVEVVGALLEHPLDGPVADDVMRSANQESGRRLREPVSTVPGCRPQAARARNEGTACRG